MRLAYIFHCHSNFVLICVRVGFREASNVDLETCQDVANVWPASSVSIPAKAVEIMEVDSGCVFVGVFVHDVADVFAR